MLSNLHQKKYKNILKYVDTQDDFDLLDFLENDLEDTLEDYGYEALDEYGTVTKQPLREPQNTRMMYLDN